MRKRRRLLPLIVTGLSLASMADAGLAEDAMNLDEVVLLALAQNADLQAELARRDEVDGAVTEAAADAWPQVEVVSSWVRSRNPSLLNSPDFEDLLEQFPDFEPGEQELWGLAVQVSQPIYSGGKVRAAVELAELAVDVTEARIQNRRLDLALVAAETYFEILKARRAVAALSAQQASRDANLKVTQDRYDLGEATELERLRATAAVAEIGPALARARGQVRVFESRLKSLLNQPPDRPVQLADSAVDGPETEVASNELPALDRLIDVALEQRPELSDLDLQIEAIDRRTTVTRAEARPQVDLEGSYGRQVRLLDDLEENLFADWRIGVGMTWKIFDGGRRKGQLAQLSSQREQLEWRRRQLVRTVSSEIEQALASYTTSLEQRRAAAPAADAAAEAARVAGESYRLGVALQADLLDAQNLAVQSRLAADTAFYDALIEYCRLRRSLGLLPALDSGPNSTLELDRGPDQDTDRAHAPEIDLDDSDRPLHKDFAP